MKILITGSNGLLGQKIVKQLLKKQIPFLATSKGENRNPDCPETRYAQMDISKTSHVSNVFTDFQPTAVMHTAAITNVDYCESNAKECELINVNSTQILFEASKQIGAQFIAFPQTLFLTD